ncbi:MAG: hypothetical protein QM749_00425 [Aquabacterium sp.]
MILPITTILAKVEKSRAAHPGDTPDQHADRVAHQLGVDVDLVLQAVATGAQAQGEKTCD